MVSFKLQKSFITHLAKLIGQSNCIGAHSFWSSTQFGSTSAWFWNVRTTWDIWSYSYFVLVLSAL